MHCIGTVLNFWCRCNHNWLCHSSANDSEVHAQCKAFVWGERYTSTEDAAAE